jgi:hypothetical protein
MTNQTNLSPNHSFQPRKALNLKTVLALVEASPFKALLKLPPEEVLDFFRSRVGQALLEGLAELKRREVEGLMSSAFKHSDMVDKFFEVRGIDSVCQALLDLPEKVRQYVDASKGAK